MSSYKKDIFMKTPEELRKEAAADKAAAELDAAKKLAGKPTLATIPDSGSEAEAEKTVSVQGEDVDFVLQLYKDTYSSRPDYKQPTKNPDGSHSVSFSSAAEMTNFLMDAAGKNAKFILVDAKTKTVMGYSNGDGKLYHADGNECNKGDELKPSSIASDKFTMPERSSPRP